MALVEWRLEYSVGVQSIDLQHQKLFEMVNELYSAMRMGNVAEVVPIILERLEIYCRKHFSYEESMMLQAEYPDYLRHKTEHAKLMEKVLVLAKDFDDDTLMRSLALLGFLNEWLQRHVISSDRQYSAYLQSAGIV
jgi:hemerythrin